VTIADEEIAEIRRRDTDWQDGARNDGASVAKRDRRALLQHIDEMQQHVEQVLFDVQLCRKRLRETDEDTEAAGAPEAPDLLLIGLKP
jgi:hypothetical protein